MPLAYKILQSPGEALTQTPQVRTSATHRATSNLSRAAPECESAVVALARYMIPVATDRHLDWAGSAGNRADTGHAPGNGNAGPVLCRTVTRSCKAQSDRRGTDPSSAGPGRTASRLQRPEPFTDQLQDVAEFGRATDPISSGSGRTMPWRRRPRPLAARRRHLAARATRSCRARASCSPELFRFRPHCDGDREQAAAHTATTPCRTGYEILQSSGELLARTLQVPAAPLPTWPRHLAAPRRDLAEFGRATDRNSSGSGHATATGSVADERLARSPATTVRECGDRNR
ncbi:hypothetical protein EV385_0722 [Krasilnikovia cinnamomea]|uniref:Uncharacterized protein n=1 Tax=Krasilnikovia cinnamomea TaxID=349313 RepID=A0A4Q7ZE99_9ACTN|nr:hypothetical protein EV385_0722 [Krasilnikovia cinnamomea]